MKKIYGKRKISKKGNEKSSKKSEVIIKINLNNMTKNEAFGLYQNLNKLGTLKGVKFAYAVSRNITLLKTEVESLAKTIEPTPEFLEMDKLRITMVEGFAKKDEKGKAVQKDNIYEIEEGKQEELDKAFDDFKAEHKELYDVRNKQVEEYNEFLKSNSDVVLYKVSISDVPTDISVNQLHSISEIISEDIPTPYPAK